MPKTTQEEKFRWIKLILDNEITIKNMVKVCPFCERSLKYWIKAYQEYGMKGLENKDTKSKSQPGETPIRVKERILEIRKETNVIRVSIDDIRAMKREADGGKISSPLLVKSVFKKGFSIILWCKPSNPSCSNYTYQAIAKYGVFKGVYMGAKRILRCNPFSHGGNDPVPEEKKKLI